MPADNLQYLEGDSANFRQGNPASEILGLMTRALALLDASEAPAEIGAYLDHAIYRLRDFIDDIASGS